RQQTSDPRRSRRDTTRRPRTTPTDRPRSETPGQPTHPQPAPPGTPPALAAVATTPPSPRPLAPPANPTQPTMTRSRSRTAVLVEFIDTHREQFGAEPICAVLECAPSTYWAAKKRELAPSARAVR